MIRRIGALLLLLVSTNVALPAFGQAAAAPGSPSVVRITGTDEVEFEFVIQQHGLFTIAGADLATALRSLKVRPAAVGEEAMPAYRIVLRESGSLPSLPDLDPKKPLATLLEKSIGEEVTLTRGKETRKGTLQYVETKSVPIGASSEERIFVSVLREDGAMDFFGVETEGWTLLFEDKALKELHRLALRKERQARSLPGKQFILSVDKPAKGYRVSFREKLPGSASVHWIVKPAAPKVDAAPADAPPPLVESEPLSILLNISNRTAYDWSGVELHWSIDAKAEGFGMVSIPSREKVDLPRLQALQFRAEATGESGVLRPRFDQTPTYAGRFSASAALAFRRYRLADQNVFDLLKKGTGVLLDQAGLSTVELTSAKDRWSFEAPATDIRLTSKSTPIYALESFGPNGLQYKEGIEHTVTGIPADVDVVFEGNQRVDTTAVWRRFDNAPSKIASLLMPDLNLLANIEKGVRDNATPKTALQCFLQWHRRLEELADAPETYSQHEGEILAIRQVLRAILEDPSHPICPTKTN